MRTRARPRGCQGSGKGRVVTKSRQGSPGVGTAPRLHWWTRERVGRRQPTHAGARPAGGTPTQGNFPGCATGRPLCKMLPRGEEGEGAGTCVVSYNCRYICHHINENKGKAFLLFSLGEGLDLLFVQQVLGPPPPPPQKNPKQLKSMEPST